jgi:hypothetical protein
MLPDTVLDKVEKWSSQENENPEIVVVDAPNHKQCPHNKHNHLFGGFPMIKTWRCH